MTDTNTSARLSKNGAIAIVHCEELNTYIPFVEYIKVEDSFIQLNRCAAIFYGNPSDKLKLFGVTGTNGKTTIAKVIKAVYSTHLKLRLHRYDRAGIRKRIRKAGLYDARKSSVFTKYWIKW